MTFEDLYNTVVKDATLIGSDDLHKRGNFGEGYDPEKTADNLERRNKNPEPGGKYQEN